MTRQIFQVLNKRGQKKKLIFIILGLCAIIYDVILISLKPGTLWDNIFAFSHIWTAFGILLIWAGLSKKKMKKRARLTFVILGGVVAIVCVVNLGFILTPETCLLEEDADYVIVLGGGIDKNGKLPKSVMTRVEVAAKYLTVHPQCVCVVTGGTLHWLPYAEAPEIKCQLMLAGIEGSRILVEDQALDTIQNFEFTSKVLSDYEGVGIEKILNTPLIVVTSRFHLRRAERLARRLGFTNIKGLGSACPAIYVLHNYVREICAYIKLNMRILLTGEPKRLSDQVRQ